MMNTENVGGFIAFIGFAVTAVGVGHEDIRGVLLVGGIGALITAAGAVIHNWPAKRCQKPIEFSRHLKPRRKRLGIIQAMLRSLSHMARVIRVFRRRAAARKAGKYVV